MRNYGWTTMAFALALGCGKEYVPPTQLCQDNNQTWCGAGNYCEFSIDRTTSRCSMIPSDPKACGLERWPGQCRTGGDGGISVDRDDTNSPPLSDAATDGGGGALTGSGGTGTGGAGGAGPSMSVDALPPTGTDAGDKPETAAPATDGASPPDSSASDVAPSSCSVDQNCAAPLICVGSKCVQPRCGDGRKAAGEDCDDGMANVAGGYGQKGKCTDACKLAAYCGDGEKNGPEKCDDRQAGRTELGACNPECSGFYEKKYLRLTSNGFTGNLGGIKGADDTCQRELGAAGGAWKALLVGGTRRATKTPLKGDDQAEWVIRKFTHYYNDSNELVWRTDGEAMLAVRNGQRMNPYAKVAGRYSWGGFNSDWTTFADAPAEARGTCQGWTSASRDFWGDFFFFEDLTHAASEPCSTEMPLLCVEQ
jgi:hypothetical protein